MNWLKFHKAMLIGELETETLRLSCRNNPNCEARKAFDHVIVDEYQDLNRAEQDLIQLLWGNKSIAIVGDVDQSIYSSRHADPGGGSRLIKRDTQERTMRFLISAAGVLPV